MRQERAAGGVVYRESGGRIEVVLGEQDDRLTGERTTRLPKGKLDRGEVPEAAALREVAEETGLRAELRGHLVQTGYRFSEGGEEVDKRVDYFLMHVIGRAGEPDGELGRIYWCDLDEAAGRLTYANEAEAVTRAIEQLKGARTR